MPIVISQFSGKQVATLNVGKLVRPVLVLELISAREPMLRWGLGKFGSNDILGAGLLTTTGVQYTVRKMNVKKA